MARLGPSTADLLDRLEGRGIRLGLAAMRRLLETLGSPQEGLPVVLVAGTNGKGSTAALVAAVAGAAGYRTGLYTSPHLEEVVERIRVGGQAIAPERFGELLERAAAAGEEACGKLPTHFEALTAAAFLHFAAEAVELAVMEVGLGGRLDATNVSQPVLSLITEVSLEHAEVLGRDLSAIAREKAGILRPGRPAVAGLGGGEAARALAAAARRCGARLAFAPERVAVEAVEAAGWGPQRVRLRSGSRCYRVELPLAGDHQVRNLSLAVAASEVLEEEGWCGMAAAVPRGLRACRWPGRLEAVELPEGKTVLLDVAHNPAGAAALESFLATLGIPYDLLFGVLADKDVRGMLPSLAAAARSVVLTRPASPRSLDPAVAAEVLAPGRARVEPCREGALALALGGPAELLVVCGSLYLVGEARRLLRRRYGVPAPASEIPTGP